VSDLYVALVVELGLGIVVIAWMAHAIIREIQTSRYQADELLKRVEKIETAIEKILRKIAKKLRR